MNNLPTTPIALLAVLIAFAGLSLFLVEDKADLITRTARTAAQTGLTLALAAIATPDLELDLVLNVIMPAMVAAATAIHGAVQPAEITE